MLVLCWIDINSGEVNGGIPSSMWICQRDKQGFMLKLQGFLHDKKTSTPSIYHL